MAHPAEIDFLVCDKLMEHTFSRWAQFKHQQRYTSKNVPVTISIASEPLEVRSAAYELLLDLHSGNIARDNSHELILENLACAVEICNQLDGSMDTGRHSVVWDAILSKFDNKEMVCRNGQDSKDAYTIFFKLYIAKQLGLDDVSRVLSRTLMAELSVNDTDDLWLSLEEVSPFVRDAIVPTICAINLAREKAVDKVRSLIIAGLLGNRTAWSSVEFCCSECALAASINFSKDVLAVLNWTGLWPQLKPEGFRLGAVYESFLTSWAHQIDVVGADGHGSSLHDDFVKTMKAIIHDTSYEEA